MTALLCFFCFICNARYVLKTALHALLCRRRIARRLLVLLLLQLTVTPVSSYQDLEKIGKKVGKFISNDIYRPIKNDGGRFVTSLIKDVGGTVGTFLSVISIDAKKRKPGRRLRQIRIPPRIGTAACGCFIKRPRQAERKRLGRSQPDLHQIRTN